MPSCVPTNDTELIPQRMHANQLRTNPYKSQNVRGFLSNVFGHQIGRIGETMVQCNQTRSESRSFMRQRAMVMKQTTMAWLSEIYNLILHPGTRQWEREQLVQAKIPWKPSWRPNKSRQRRKRIVK